MLSSCLLVIIAGYICFTDLQGWVLLITKIVFVFRQLKFDLLPVRLEASIADSAAYHILILV
jgi:hypothetical protein